MILLLAGRGFDLVQAMIGIVVLLVLSVPLGFLIALGLRKWHEAHPVEEVENEKRPLGL